MQMANGKVCLECKAKLARYYDNAFCESCFRQLLKEHLAEEDKRHEMQALQQAT